MRSKSKALIIVCATLLALVFIWRKTSVNEPVISNESCGRIPQEKDIFIDNVIWQLFQLRNRTYQLYKAHYDDRQNKSIVRISMMGLELIKDRDIIYCQFWFDEDVDSVPVVVVATQFVIQWHDCEYMKQNHLFKHSLRHFSGFAHDAKYRYPYLLTCPIDFSKRVPVAVSLTQKPCDKAENKLMVINNQPIDGVKKTFGVCSKFLFFEDRKQVIRFIEWVEMLRILGVEKITMFNHHVHAEHFEILNYYKEQGILDFHYYLEPTGLPDGNNNYKLRQREMIETLLLTDCFFRNRNL
jgi:hypothetical protein